MTSWLNKQKKQTLLELSAEAGLKQDDDVRKDDLIDNLDKYLQANSTRLARNTSFQPYFDTRRTPFKARSSSAGGVTSDDGEVKSVVKARGRRTTKVKPEVEDEDVANLSPSNALASASNAISNAITPAKSRRRSQLLPPSPADVADDMEDAAQKFYSGLTDIWNDSGIPEIADRIREQCSSGLAVQATALALEAYGLQKTVLPRRFAFDIPSIRLGRIETPSYAVKVPDLFQLVTAGFWYNSLLWSATSIFIPLLFSYFYNLRVRDTKRVTRSTVTSHGFDPLIFNVVKAILVYVIFGQGYNFGFIDRRAIAAVNISMVGGYQGMLIGSYVGILVALYEAAQGK